MIERPILFSSPMVRAILDGTKTQTRRAIRIDDSPILTSKPGVYQRGIPRNAQNVRMCASYLKCDAPAGSAAVSSRVPCPYGFVDERLWVRETWASAVGVDSKAPVDFIHQGWPIWYAVDDSVAYPGASNGGPSFMTRGKTRVSIHMPREASRITLEINEVRVQRLQQISGEDARAEGVQYPVSTKDCPPGTCKPLFALGDGTIDRAIEWGIYSRPGQRAEREPTHDDMSRLYFAQLWDSINGKRPGCSWRDNPWLWCISFKRVEQSHA